MLRLGRSSWGPPTYGGPAEFWGRALGYVPRDGVVDEGWTVLVPADGRGVAMALGRSTSPVQEKPRVHVDLYVEDRAEQEAEVARLTGLGAERVDWELYPEDPDFVVLADPEGNRFCVIDASHTPADQDRGRFLPSSSSHQSSDSGSPEGASHHRSSGPRRFATIAATGGITMANRHIPTAAGTDQIRTTAQARTKRTTQTPIITKYQRRRRAYMSPE